MDVNGNGPQWTGVDLNRLLSKRSLSVSILLLCGPLLAETPWEGRLGDFSAQIITPPSTQLFEKFPVKVTLKYPDTYHFDLPELKNHLMEHSVLHAPPFSLFKTEEEKKTENAFVIQTIQFQLVPQLAGDFPITLGELQFLPDGDNLAPVTILAPPLSLKVSSIQTQPPPLLPIAPPLPYSTRWPLELTEENKQLVAQATLQQPAYLKERFAKSAIPWPPILFLAFFIFILLFGRNYLIAPETITPRQRAAKAKRLARQALETLPEPSLSPKASYVETSKIVKNLLSEGYQLFPTGATTEECLDKVRSYSALADPVRKPLEQLLIKADLVNFATIIPSQQEAIEARQTAYSLLKCIT